MPVYSTPSNKSAPAAAMAATLQLTWLARLDGACARFRSVIHHVIPRIMLRRKYLTLEENTLAGVWVGTYCACQTLPRTGNPTLREILRPAPTGCTPAVTPIDRDIELQSIYFLSSRISKHLTHSSRFSSLAGHLFLHMSAAGADIENSETCVANRKGCPCNVKYASA